MAVIYLIRHGQTGFKQADYDQLSATGRQQAKCLGAQLAARAVRP